jgi:membrane protein DedA with SNARE-associated domain
MDQNHLIDLEHQILTALQQIFDQFGWLGVFGIMAFENATGITPSEVVLSLAGWLLINNHGLGLETVFLGGLVAAIGSVLGASLIYWFARLGGRPAIERVARSLRIPLRHIDWTASQFQRWGPGLVLFGRLIPGVRMLISIPAGLARMPFAQYLLATFTGTYLWCTLFLGVGYLVGHEWQHILELGKSHLGYLLGAAALLGAICLAVLRASKRLPDNAPETG